MAEGCLSVASPVVKVKAEHALNQEEGEEDMSGTQFVCETVIRSLTLDAAPDHNPPQKTAKVLQSKYCCLLWLDLFAVRHETQIAQLKWLISFNCFFFFLIGFIRLFTNIARNL